MSDGPITRLKTPVRLDYQIRAGVAQTPFLNALVERKLLGTRFPKVGHTYVPTRGMCPVTGELSDETVEVAPIGTLTTFCVINIPFEGQRLKPPYVAGAILLDGTDLPIFHIVAGVSPDEVRMGMRVRGLWVDDDQLAPTLASISHFEPTGEADADYVTYAEHL